MNNRGMKLRRKIGENNESSGRFEVAVEPDWYKISRTQQLRIAPLSTNDTTMSSIVMPFRTLLSISFRSHRAALTARMGRRRNPYIFGIRVVRESYFCASPGGYKKGLAMRQCHAVIHLRHEIQPATVLVAGTYLVEPSLGIY